MKTCKNCKHYKRSEIIGVKCCEFGLHESYCEKDKEDFAIVELEKIRAKIEDTGAYEQEVNGKTEFLKGITYCLNVIDKYRAELKTERREQ